MSELHSHACFDALATLQNVQNIEEMYCNYCGADHTTTDCPELCKGIHFRNTPQIMDTATGAGNASDAAADGRNGSGAHPDHSRTSVPAGLHVLDDRSGGTAASTHATYVITSQKFAKGSRFGPLLAKKSCVPVEPAVRFPLVIFGNLGIADDLDDCPELNELFKVRNVYLDTSQPADCNWMVHVTPAAFRNEQNLIAYQQDGSIYFMSIADIEVGDVLKVWYAPLYANKMWVPLLQDSQHQIVNNVLQQLTMDQQQQSQQLHHPMQQQQQHQHHHHHQQHQQQQHQVQHPQSNGGGGHHMANASGAAAPYPTVESVGGPPSNLQTYHQQQQQIAAAAASAASAAASASSSAQNTNNAATPSIAGTNNNNNHPNNNGPVALPSIQSIIKSSYPKTDYATNSPQASVSRSNHTVPNVYPPGASGPHHQQQHHQQLHQQQLQQQHQPQHHHQQQQHQQQHLQYQQHHQHLHQQQFLHQQHQQHPQHNHNPHHHHHQQQHPHHNSGVLQHSQHVQPHQPLHSTPIRQHYAHHQSHPGHYPGALLSPTAASLKQPHLPPPHLHAGTIMPSTRSGSVVHSSPASSTNLTTLSNSNGSNSSASASAFDGGRPAASVSLVDDDDHHSGGSASGRSTKKKVYQCEVCDKKYATMTNIYKHMRSHQLYLCSLCMRTFPHEHQIKEHKCPQGSVKTPQCHVCFKYLSNSWSLTRHMKIHAHELDESGNYTKHTAATASDAAAGGSVAGSGNGGGIGDSGVTVSSGSVPPLADPAVGNGAPGAAQQQQLSPLMPMLPMQVGISGGGGGSMVRGTQLAAADSSSGVVRVHEVDISEVTSCSLATSCSSDLLHTSGDLSMMSADHSQDYVTGDEMQMHLQMQLPPGSASSTANGGGAHLQMLQMHTGVGALAGGEAAVTDADTTSLDATAESPDDGGGADEAVNGADGLECTVCLKHFKSDFRLIKHQRQVHTVRIKPSKTPTAEQQMPAGTAIATNPVSTSSKTKRPASGSMYAQNLAPPVTPDVAKALASKLNERNPNHYFQQQQQHQLQQQHQQQQHQQQQSNNSYLNAHQQHMHQQQQHQHMQQHQQQLQQQQHSQQQQQQHPNHMQQPYPAPSNATWNRTTPEKFQSPAEQQQQSQTQSQQHQMPQQVQKHMHQQQQQPQHHPQQHIGQAMQQQQQLPQNQHQMQQHLQPQQQKPHDTNTSSPNSHFRSLPPDIVTMHLNPAPATATLQSTVLHSFSDAPAALMQPIATQQHNGDTAMVGAASSIGGGDPATDDDSKSQQSTTEAPFECDVCHKQFQKRNQLTKHRPIHDNNHFVCPYCPNTKSVKAKSTMQKHLRAMHEDRIEEWKVPGFVNALLTAIDIGKSSANISTSSMGTGDGDGTGDPADTNNNLDRMLGLVGGAVGAERQKRPGSHSPLDDLKRFRPMVGDCVDDVSSSCATPMLTPMMMAGSAPDSDQLLGSPPPPPFGRHPDSANSGGLYNGSNGCSFLMFDSPSAPTANTGYMTPQKQQLDRFHHKLDSLEIVDAGRMQLDGVESGVGAPAEVTADPVNGGADVMTGADVMSSGHLMMVSGVSDGSNVVGGSGGGWNSFGGPLAMSNGGGVTAGGEVETEDGGAYEHFYEDYMVL